MGARAVSGCRWAASLPVFGGGGVVSSILRCVLTSDAILFLDAFFALFRLLPMTCLLIVLVLARLSRAVGGFDGPVLILVDRRCVVAVRAGTGSALVVPLSMTWACPGLSPGSTLSLRM